MEASLLKQVPLFSDLSEEELTTLSALSKKRSYAKNTVIITEGDSGDALYVISSGQVKLIRSNEEGEEVILAVLRGGHFFGEMALIEGEPRSATAVTAKASQLFTISRVDFENCLARNPQISGQLMRSLAKRLRAADQMIESLALMDVYGRLASVLLQLAQPEDGKLVIRQKYTHQDLANMIGASREMVSRILRDLARRGYITIEAKQITIYHKLPLAWH